MGLSRSSGRKKAGEILLNEIDKTNSDEAIERVATCIRGQIMAELSANDLTEVANKIRDSFDWTAIAQVVARETVSAILPEKVLANISKIRAKVDFLTGVSDE